MLIVTDFFVVCHIIHLLKYINKATRCIKNNIRLKITRIIFSCDLCIIICSDL